MRLNLYSGKEQKEHIDEGVERVMAKNGWEQSFSLEFVRLGFGFAAVAVALYVWYIEKTVPFRDSRVFCGLLCALYFVFTWGAWLWQRYVEKNAMYIGTKNGAKTWIATKNPKNTDKYEVKVITKSPEGETMSQDCTFTIQQIVDTTGVVHEENLTKIVELVSAESRKRK